MSQLSSFDAKTVEALLREQLKPLSIKPAVLVNAMRVTLTGQAKGPDFMASLACLGKDTVSRRLIRASSLFWRT